MVMTNVKRAKQTQILKQNDKYSHWHTVTVGYAFTFHIPNIREQTFVPDIILTFITYSSPKHNYVNEK